MKVKELNFATPKLIVLRVNKQSKAKYITPLREGDIITLNTEFSNTYNKKVITIKRDEEIVDTFTEGLLSEFLWNVELQKCD